MASSYDDEGFTADDAAVCIVRPAGKKTSSSSMSVCAHDGVVNIANKDRQ